MRFITIPILLLLISDVSLARVWHVPAELPSVRQAMEYVEVGDTVEVACGSYHESDIVMSVPITLRSATGLADCVTIDGESDATILICDWPSGDAVVEGITFTGGHGETAGGILVLGGATVTITDCVLRENQAGTQPGGGSGGGVVCSELARGSLIRCRLLDNGAYRGGGVGCYGHATVNLEECLLVNNNAVYGGGLEVRDDVVCTVAGCTFAGNASWAWYGGGITSFAASAPAISNTIIGFSVPGSAVDGTFTFFACDLFGNEHGDWVGSIADQLGVNGNICADPFFCDPDNRVFTLAADSPCLPENNDVGELMGAFGEGCDAVPVAPGQLPSAAGIVLHEVYPNPFNPETIIVYELREPARVYVRVFDATGRLVKTVEMGMLREAGRHAAAWSGRDEGHRPLPSGRYFCRLTAGDSAATTSMTLVR